MSGSKAISEAARLSRTSSSDPSEAPAWYTSWMTVSSLLMTSESTLTRMPFARRNPIAVHYLLPYTRSSAIVQEPSWFGVASASTFVPPGPILPRRIWIGSPA